MGRTSYVGVDVGGGGIRARIEVGNARTGHDEMAPVPRERGRVDLRAVSRHVAAVVKNALTGTDRLSGVAIGITGMPGLAESPDVLWKALKHHLDVETLIVAGDAVTSHVGALDFRPGVVLAAGTGVMTLGTDLAGVWNRSDGWGHLLGDHGGGAWIGREGLHAALRAYDGRVGGSRALRDLMVERFGDPMALVRLVYGSDSAAHHLASFAPAVADAARDGDPIAEAIWTESGVQLGRTAVAAATGLEPAFSWSGRLFDAGELLLAPFRDTIRSLLPGAHLAVPHGTSTDGALALAHAAAGGGLAPRPPYLHLFTTP